MIVLMNTATSSTDTWIAKNDGTVTDVATGLIWQQQDDGVTRIQTEALNYCQDLTLGNNANWRLPTIKELFSIVDHRNFGPRIDGNDFLNTVGLGYYWSSSDVVSDSDSTWVVNFYAGSVIPRLDDDSDYVYTRCVR